MLRNWLKVSMWKCESIDFFIQFEELQKNGKIHNFLACKMCNHLIQIAHSPLSQPTNSLPVNKPVLLSPDPGTSFLPQPRQYYRQSTWLSIHLVKNFSSFSFIFIISSSSSYCGTTDGRSVSRFLQYVKKVKDGERHDEENWMYGDGERKNRATVERRELNLSSSQWKTIIFSIFFLFCCWLDCWLWAGGL